MAVTISGSTPTKRQTPCGRLIEGVELPCPNFWLPGTRSTKRSHTRVYTQKSRKGKHSTSHHTETQGTAYTLSHTRYREIHTQGNTRVAVRRRETSQARGTGRPLLDLVRTVAAIDVTLTSGSVVARVTLTCLDSRVSIQLCQYRPGPPSSPKAAWGQLLVNRE